MPKDSTGPERELRHEIELRDRQLEAARRISAELSSITKLDQTIQEALNISLDVVDAHAGSIILLDPKSGKLVFRYVVGEKAEELTGLQLEPGQGIAGSVFQSGHLRVSEDMTAEKDHFREVGERIHYKTHNMVTVPLKSYQGRCIGVMQVLNKSDGHFDEHDVATLDILGAQVAAAVEAARLQEEARLAQVVSFIGDISHDVKNMITPVQTSAETLRFISDDVFEQFDRALDSRELPAGAADGLRSTVQELRDLLPEMVELILDGADTVQQRMAEISAAVKGIVSQPHFEKADILEVARRAVALLEHQASKAGIAVGVEAVGEVPAFALDKKQIYNAVYNLVFNAIDACGPGSSITIRVSAAPDGEFPEGGYCLLQCVDTGSGMPEHVRAKLFTDDAVSTKPMGTGLGTRIIKNVIEAHDGTIGVDSETGVGTTISCRIPLAREETRLEPAG